MLYQRFVESPQIFAEFGVKMIFDGVVSSTRKMSSNERPLVTQLVVKVVERLFFIVCPVFGSDGLVEVIVIPAVTLWYLSLHCLPVRPGKLWSVSIFLAITLHFFRLFSSLRSLRVWSS